MKTIALNELGFKANSSNEEKASIQENCTNSKVVMRRGEQLMGFFQAHQKEACSNKMVPFECIKL